MFRSAGQADVSTHEAPPTTTLPSVPRVCLQKLHFSSIFLDVPLTPPLSPHPPKENDAVARQPPREWREHYGGRPALDVCNKLYKVLCAALFLEMWVFFFKDQH